MKTECIEYRFQVCQPDELASADRQLTDAACRATGTSYSPYSHFAVGAAVLLGSGRVVTGSNQENAAYGICQCAERNALFAAACQYPDDVPVAIAIAARTAGGFLSSPIPPCGACRQAMLETEARYGISLRVLMYGTDGVWACDGVANLLPLQFKGETMCN